MTTDTEAVEAIAVDDEEDWEAVYRLQGCSPEYA